MPEQDVYRLIDNDNHTYWHVSLDRLGEQAWVLVDFGKDNKKVIRSLSALPRKDIPRQFFRKAELFGSNNGEEWKFISNIPQMKVPNEAVWREWKFDNDRAFQFYKLLIFDGHENGDAHRFYSMAELALSE